MRDLSNNVVAVVGTVPAVVTADANGTGVDLQGFESAMVIVNTIIYLLKKCQGFKYKSAIGKRLRLFMSYSKFLGCFAFAFVLS